MALVVNMIGGPGRGKSTAAYNLIGRLKKEGYKCELLVEYCKFAAYADAHYEFKDQLHMMVEHNHKLKVLATKVDIVVTDTSFLNCVAYCNEEEQFEKMLAYELYSRYTNINIVVPRKELYRPYGRHQTEDQAKDLDTRILDSINDGIKKGFISPYLNMVEKDTQEEDIYKLVVDKAHKMGYTPTI